MFFRILLIAMISWGILKLYRILTGKGGGKASTFQRRSQPRRYQGTAVDADFEDIDEKRAREDGN